MTVHNRSIKDAITQNSGVFGKDVVSIIYCTVNSVDEVAGTCDVTPITEGDDTPIPGVLLKAENNDGLMLVPDVDSTVIVGMTIKKKCFILLCEDISKFLLVIGDSKLEVTDGLFSFNGGTLDGMVKVNSLVTKINALETLVNNILNVLKTTSIPLAPSGTYPFAPLYTALSDIAPLTNKAALENTAIKQ